MGWALPSRAGEKLLLLSLSLTGLQDWKGILGAGSGLGVLL